MAEKAINNPTSNNQEKPVILVADDSRVVRTSLKNILNNDCYLIEAEDGLKAWELLLEQPDVRLIFSDLSMPQLDGRGLLKKIRESEINRIRNLPFIVVTGNEQNPELRQSLQDAGATEIITKPFDPASIVSFVTTLVSRQEEESYFILGEIQNQTEFLPGVANQSHFMEQASKELSFAIRNKNEIAVALLKIDQFSHICEHYSEPAVEHILLSIVEIMRRHIHPDDTMAYFGEGLFAMLRPASNAIGTRYIGRRILDDLKAKQFYLGESDEAVSASIGISAPEIKHGTRLRELLLLAEGRLKAAMDLGGGRVIDKGSDTLTPLGGMHDSLLVSTTHPSQESSSDHSPTRSEAEQLSERVAAQSGGDTQETARQLAEMHAVLERLSKENKSLQEEVERWRRQSGESEQLRHRIFELESEQQQVQVRLGELQAENHQLRQLSERAEADLQALRNSDEERTETLKQANQFYAEENLRLEGQFDALSNRAQKAELASRKSEQLIVSLKDNIALLRAQLEQTQGQLAEARQLPQAAADSSPPPPETPVPSAPEPGEAPEQLDEITSNLVFDGFPSREASPPKRPPVVAMFPNGEPAIAPSKPIPAKQEEASQKTVKIPTYSLEDDWPVPEPRRPLSSFAIASLILLTLLALGGAYLFSYLKQDNLTATAQISTRGEMAKTGGSSPTTRPAATASGNVLDALRNHKPSARQSAPPPAPPATGRQAGYSEEAKLQAELTLRQMAEETFNQQLHQLDSGDRTSDAAYSDTSPEQAQLPTEPDTSPPQATADTAIATPPDIPPVTPPQTDQ